MNLNNGFHIFKVRRNIIETKAQKRLGKRDEGFKITLPMLLGALAVTLLFNLDDAAVEKPHRVLILLIVGLLSYFVACFLKFRRKSPRSCWRNATLASVGMMVLMLIIPWLPFERAPINDMVFLRYFLIAAAVSFVISIGCFLRLRYIRRRSRAEVAVMRMRRKRQRATL